MPQKALIIAFLSSFLLGCAGQQEQPAEEPTVQTAGVSYDEATVQQIKAEAKPVEVSSAAAENDRIVCVKETSVNSMIPRRVCYRQSELRDQARRTQSWMEDEMYGDGYVRDSVLPR